MITAHYSTVLEHPVDTVWALIRDFNNYPAYIDGVSESVIEDGKRGDEIGAVRRFLYGATWIRQQLRDHSDENRSLSYAGLEPLAFPDDSDTAPARYEGTIRLLPVVEGARTFIEWSVGVDTRAEDGERWRGLLSRWIPEWTDSLARTLARGRHAPPGP